MDPTRPSRTAPRRRRAAVSLALLFLAVASPILAAAAAFSPDQPNEIRFAPVEARFIRVLLTDCQEGEPCIDELEVYGSGQANLALAVTGAKAAASSLLPGYAIHQVAHLNDGLYGNGHSWIAAGTRAEWAQIELPRPAAISRVVFSRDREGGYRDRVPGSAEVRVSLDGNKWTTVASVRDASSLPDGPLTDEDLLRYAYRLEDLSLGRLEPPGSDPLKRVSRQFSEMVARFATRGLDVTAEQRELQDFQRAGQVLSDPAERQQAAWKAHLAKRRLLFRDPDLAPIARILFVKRQPFEPSHNYSDIFDSQGAPGGAVCTLDIPMENGRLEPERKRLSVLFDAGAGIARDPAIDFAAQTVWFGYRKSKSDYYRIWNMRADGTGAHPVTDGPFHDYYPCPLPDGGVAFVSTRCKARFLCWRPQAFVLFRMEADGSGIRPLSHANLSEWTPSVLGDGRILWMRSEYVDKGANFGHTLWAIRPDGTLPDLVFGNDTDFCYANGREVPGTGELVCTLVSHGGDLNGPIALVQPQHGRFNPAAVRSLTPDVPPQFDMNWLRRQCFRDPTPVSRDYFLCSHAPADKFGLYLIDRFGNRELLYLDPDIGSMAPVLLRPSIPPPVLAETALAENSESGQFLMEDVHLGLDPAVARGRVKFLRVCQEIRADLRQLANGEYQNDHEPFLDWYATPVHKVSGPGGWPSYVAKGDLGLVPVEADGSANFTAPAGKVLYFQALDADLNELQRMRSVVQLQPGERRGCVGCHEDRNTAPAMGRSLPLAFRRSPSPIEPPPWGAGAFAYEKVVQPVWDNHCVRCHDGRHKTGLNLAGTTDPDGVPASYRSLIQAGWVDYFDWGYAQRHRKAQPLTFGTLKSRLWTALAQDQHREVNLSPEDRRRITTWIDLNCPLWPDYRFRPERPGVLAGAPANAR